MALLRLSKERPELTFVTRVFNFCDQEFTVGEWSSLRAARHNAIQEQRSRDGDWEWMVERVFVRERHAGTRRLVECEVIARISSVTGQWEDFSGSGQGPRFYSPNFEHSQL